MFSGSRQVIGRYTWTGTNVIYLSAQDVRPWTVFWLGVHIVHHRSSASSVCMLEFYPILCGCCRLRVMEVQQYSVSAIRFRYVMRVTPTHTQQTSVFAWVKFVSLVDYPVAGCLDMLALRPQGRMVQGHAFKHTQWNE